MKVCESCGQDRAEFEVEFNDGMVFYVCERCKV